MATEKPTATTRVRGKLGKARQGVRTGKKQPLETPWEKRVRKNAEAERQIKRVKQFVDAGGQPNESDADKALRKFLRKWYGRDLSLKNSETHIAVEKEFNPDKIDSGRAVEGTETSTAKEVNRLSEPRKEALLDRYRIMADETIAVTLAFMGVEDRHTFLDLHYPNRTKWAAVRSQRPTPSELLIWVEENFSDRHELGLVQSDLKHLDKDAYDKVTNWTRPKRDGSIVKLSKDFGFPLKDKNFSSIIAKNTPSAKAVQESMNRRSPDAPKLLQRYQRGQYHIMKM